MKFKIIGLVFLCLVSGCQSRPQTVPKKPNILFIAVDDLRPILGCYGNNFIKTPHIDCLAAGGTTFLNSFCNVPVCGPSRVSVLSGLRTKSNMWSTNNLKRPFVTMAKHFKANGYQSISNGKILHIMPDRASDWSEAPWRSEAIYHGKGDWAGYNQYNVWQSKEAEVYMKDKKGRGPYCEAADVADNAYQDGKLADKTIKDLKRFKKSGEPFFLACGFWRPHLPLNAPKKYWDLYKRKDIPLANNRYLPKNLPKQCKGSSEMNKYKKAKDRQTDEFHREARHAYYACVSYVDAQIGKILDTLDILELTDNTIVVLWGDHGWNLGEHTYWGKHNSLKNSLHAPLIIRAPGHKTKNTTEALVELVDIYPTLCALTQTKAKYHLDGDNLIPLLNNPQAKWKDAVYSSWQGSQSIKTQQYLYTEWKKDGQVTDQMLFDHNKDPDENNNIADDLENKSLVKKLSEKLNASQ